LSRENVSIFATSQAPRIVAHWAPVQPYHVGRMKEMSESASPEGLFVDGPRRDRALTFFSLSTCAMCRKAREYLQEKGFAYRVLLVDQLPGAEKDRLKEELSRKHGMRVAFPALLVDDSRIVLGFFRKAWDEALDETGDDA